MTELLTSDDVAAIVHTSPETVRYWRSQGIGPHYAKIGKRVLYRRSDVEEWLTRTFTSA